MTHLQEVQLGRSITSLFFASAGSRGPPTTTPLHPPPRTRLQHRIHQFNDLWCLNTVGGVGRQMSNWDTTTLCCSAAQLANMLMLGGNHAGEAARPPRQQLSPLLALLLPPCAPPQDTWEWSRLSGDEPDAPRPCPRDRASLVALGSGRLLLVGGADAMNRRLDDAWVFDLER